ncbi:MAG: ChaN family lipoprotein [Nitrospirales bacterium]
MLDMKPMNISRLPSLVFPFALRIVIIYGFLGCTAVQVKPSFEVGQIYRVSDQNLVTVKDLTPHLLAADVIYLGEEHYTPSHLEAAKTILNILLAHQHQPSLAMEMFSWDGQPGLDRFIHHPEITPQQLLEESNWKNNWGGEFADYQSLVNFAKSHQLNLIALNPPRPLVRLVATQGLTKAMEDPAMKKWPIGELVADDPEYENLIFEQIESCHAGLPDHVYRRIFEASIFRDEGMAHIISNYLNHKSPSEGPLVSYTGGGHIQYHIPIPKRVKRMQPEVKTVTIYLVAWDPSKEKEVRAELQNGIADYLWLTPLGPKGLQERCG